MILLILNSPVVLLGASKAVSHGIFPDAGQNAPKMILARSGGWVSCEWTLEPIPSSTDTCFVYSRFKLHTVSVRANSSAYLVAYFAASCVFVPGLILSSGVGS